MTKKEIGSALEAFYSDCESEFCSQCNYGFLCAKYEDCVPRATHDYIKKLEKRNCSVSRIVKRGNYYCPNCGTQMESSGYCIKCGQLLY
ncbi:MAG TPA: hypothetical protein DHW61_15515 [Lachnoclostridium phytofermentans]|uniref:Zinc-ribbon domain-containing protein n=1 Tax=Lachnoclostridium phytofermentans TaxID=66219 RepID=A0A3D2XBS4_9FIRM|nr:hypothetical protein [Lachnoclostridium phytofermentans]